MATVGRLQATIWRDYASSIGLEGDVRYLSGAPLRPVVPLDTAIGGVFVLGAYPSARFETVKGVTDVPVADNLGPFENERWFDGGRVRVQPSARELNDYFLDPLGVQRSECWITDLVKVFLFKEGHREKYSKLGKETPPGYERERFNELAHRSLPWIMREVEAAKPRMIVTLGEEVASVVRGALGATVSRRLLQPAVESITWDRVAYPTIHCAHPGILMRPAPRNPWPARHTTEFVPAMAKHLAQGV